MGWSQVGGVYRFGRCLSCRGGRIEVACVGRSLGLAAGSSARASTNHKRLHTAIVKKSAARRHPPVADTTYIDGAQGGIPCPRETRRRSHRKSYTLRYTRYPSKHEQGGRAEQGAIGIAKRCKKKKNAQTAVRERDWPVNHAVNTDGAGAGTRWSAWYCSLYFSRLTSYLQPLAVPVQAQRSSHPWLPLRAPPSRLTQG